MDDDQVRPNDIDFNDRTRFVIGMMVNVVEVVLKQGDDDCKEESWACLKIEATTADGETHELVFMPSLSAGLMEGTSKLMGIYFTSQQIDMSDSAINAALHDMLSYTFDEGDTTLEVNGNEDK